MSETLIGYARCSTDAQDLTAQRDRLHELGAAEERIYLDHGLTGTNRKRPGLDQAPAAVRAGDTLVVPKLDRLARSVPDARAIGDDLADRGIKLSLGGQVYDPADPMGKMFFNILATFAEFEVDLLRMRTREGMAVARAIGDDLAGRGIKLSLGGQVYDPAGPMGKMFSTSWPRSPSSRSTCCGCAPARAWPSPARRANCAASSPSCPPGSSASWRGWPPLATTRSPTSPSCSPSRATVYRILQRAPAADKAR